MGACGENAGWFDVVLISPVGSAPQIVNGKALFALRLWHHQLQCFGAKLSTCFCLRTSPLPLKSWRKPVAFKPAHLCRSPGHGRTEQQGGPRQKSNQLRDDARRAGLAGAKPRGSACRQSSLRLGASCQDVARLLRLGGHRIDAARAALDRAHSVKLDGW